MDILVSYLSISVLYTFTNKIKKKLILTGLSASYICQKKHPKQISCLENFTHDIICFFSRGLIKMLTMYQFSYDFCYMVIFSNNSIFFWITAYLIFAVSLWPGLKVFVLEKKGQQLLYAAMHQYTTFNIKLCHNSFISIFTDLANL